MQRRIEGGKAKELDWPEEKLVQYWKAIDDPRQTWEERFAAVVSDLFDDDQEDLLDRLPKAIDPQAALTASLEARQEIWLAAFRGIYQAGLRSFGQASRQRTQEAARGKGLYPADQVKAVEDQDAFGRFTSDVQSFITTTSMSKVTRIMVSSATMLRGVLEQAVRDELDMPGIARRIQGQFATWKGESGEEAEIDFPRAMRIARTEMGAVANYGNRMGAVAAADEMGLGMERYWLSTPDSRRRDSHARMHRERIGLDGVYSNGLEFPGDPKGPAREVINCRCVEGFEVVEMDRVTEPQPVEAELEPFSPIPEDDAKDLTTRMSSDRLVEAGFDEHDLVSLSAYSGSAYREINASLRAGKDPGFPYDEILEDLQGAFGKPGAILQHDTLLHRGLKMKRSDLPPDLDFDAMVGTTLTDAAFASTTAAKDTSRGFIVTGHQGEQVAMRMEIRARKGQKAIPLEGITQNQGEYEYLLPAGTKFKISEVRMEPLWEDLNINTEIPVLVVDMVE